LPGRLIPVSAGIERILADRSRVELRERLGVRLILADHGGVGVAARLPVLAFEQNLIASLGQGNFSTFIVDHLAEVEIDVIERTEGVAGGPRHVRALG
jgi:hypothetical protein